MMWVETVLILIIIYLVMTDEPADGMTSGVKRERAEQIAQNAHLFSKFGSLKAAKRKLSWMDPVTYEDMRNLSLQGKFDETNIINILNV